MTADEKVYLLGEEVGQYNGAYKVIIRPSQDNLRKYHNAMWTEDPTVSHQDKSWTRVKNNDAKKERETRVPTPYTLRP